MTRNRLQGGKARMKLQGEDGIVVELDVTGYQAPHINDDWLVVAGRIDHPRGAWSFRYPCLTTFEVERLARWFDDTAAGQAERLSCSFVEPNLEFSYEPSSGVMRACFTRECSPPWWDARRKADGVIVTFPIVDNNPQAVAAGLREWLARYPVRGPGATGRRQ